MCHESRIYFYLALLLWFLAYPQSVVNKYNKANEETLEIEASRASSLAQGGSLKRTIVGAVTEYN